MPRALITGITGQDGMYLAELLLAKGYRVYGLVCGQNNPKRAPVEQEVPGVQLVTGDLTDLASLIRAYEQAQRLGWEPTVSFSQLVELMVDADLAEQQELAGA